MDEKEFELKKEELELQRKQIQHNIDASKSKNRERISLYIGLVVAIIGIFGNLANNVVQGNINEKLDKQTFESDLIKWALESDDRTQNRLNLKFLLDGSLIKDKDGAILKLVTDTTSINIPYKANFRCIEIVSKDDTGKVINVKRKCSEDAQFLNEYIKDFMKTSAGERSVTCKWILP
ncbi:hypothetical protein [Aquimarina sp. 2201CG14-23]|uniref:hypothetical protein n=1 Tax=Aquimarina mycalae TaxID=3040073 RepID=UPI002477F7C4|nr:hypothetical protein [Aquimarina sp. 2201CG14-23]MDH7445655.1 hypothetical protein [Aquimarina sp. 2201CG14-23]